MNKIIFRTVIISIATALALSQLAIAQQAFSNAEKATDEIENIISRYQETPGAEGVNIGRFLIGAAKALVTDKEARMVMNYAKSIKVLEMEKTGSDIKNKFKNAINGFKSRLSLGYKIMEVNDGDDNIIIIGDEKKVSAILVLSDGETVLVRVDMTPDQLSEIVTIAG